MRVHFAIDLKIASVIDELPAGLMKTLEAVVRDSVADFRRRVEKKLGGAVTATALLGSMVVSDEEMAATKE